MSFRAVFLQSGHYVSPHARGSGRNTGEGTVPNGEGEKETEMWNFPRRCGLVLLPHRVPSVDLLWVTGAAGGTRGKGHRGCLREMVLEEAGGGSIKAWRGYPWIRGCSSFSETLRREVCL